MMVDADAARKVFEHMQGNLVQDFISGFLVRRVRSHAAISRHAAASTLCIGAVCGYAYCLDYRSHGKACQHGPCNYSSEMSDAFLPDSIGSPDSPFDLVELINLGQSACFGSGPSEQSDNRREAFDDPIADPKRGNVWVIPIPQRPSSDRESKISPSRILYISQVMDVVSLPCASTMSRCRKSICRAANLEA